MASVRGRGEQVTMKGREVIREAYMTRNWKYMRFKYLVSSNLDRFPRLKRLVSHLIKSATLLRYERRRKQLVRKYGEESQPHLIHWIDPEKIQYASLKRFPPNNKYGGKEISGEWDKLTKKFTDSCLYIAFKERFIDGKGWEETAFYQKTLDMITNGEFVRRCRNKTDLDKRCQGFDSLYEDIKTRGYKTQSELMPEEYTRNPIRIPDEISVNIGRYGDLLFNNSEHRLSIAKLLCIQNVPVVIIIRHPQWQKLQKTDNFLGNARRFYNKYAVNSDL